MLAALRHRGPDGSGVEVVPDPRGQDHPAVLVQTRLAIRDLTAAGRQPMADGARDDGQRNWVVFNGEVYNFRELHAELAGAGWPCRTRCDTEVILHGYRVWGERAVERFRGMFAWCLLDTRQGTAWFCRDRLGIKPLYLFRPAMGGLLFASEVRALLAAGPALVPPHVCPAALESYLAQGAVYGADTIVAGIELLEPGHSLVTDWSGRPHRSAAYWHLPFARETTSTPTERTQSVAALHETLREAVGMRLLADVPVGLFLSGGIDSAALATVATEVNGSQVQTVSIGFDQPEFDETEAAARVARALGTEHRTLRLTGADVLADLPDVLAAVDQPTVDGFNTYFVARQARRAGLTVALSGVGGDELFGGYASFRDVPRAVRWRTRLRPLRPAVRPAARLLAGVLGRGPTKVATLLDRPVCPLHAYLLRRELFLPGDRRSLHRLPAGCEPHCGLDAALTRDMLRQTNGLDAFNQVSLFELSGYLRHMLLRDADVFSMAHGLEVRVPLLDHRLVEQVAALPGGWKRANGRPKALLLDAVGPRLPAHVHAGPKRGFTFPWDAWLHGPLRDRAQRALADGDVWSELGLDPMAPARLWRRYDDGDRSVAGLQVLALMVLADYAARHGLRQAA